jgi:hypothetical protein
MGKIVMPKNSALLNEIESVLKIYYDSSDWLENDVYTERLKSLIGADQYQSSYTKKAQITSYFGFTIWENLNNPQSRRRITESGKSMYEAILANDKSKIVEVLMRSLESVKFGRDNYGCPESDSDVEPPALFIRAILDLGYITYKEFAFLLWKLEDIGGNYTDAIKLIKEQNRIITLDEAAIKYTDAKPIMILIRWGFLVEVDDATKGKRIGINSEVLRKYEKRLRNLKIYNIDMNVDKPFVDNNLSENVVFGSDSIKRLEGASNIILYGVPGAGKSWTIKNEYCNDDDRMERLVFHPDYTYSDFVGQILPRLGDDGSVKYVFTPGPFTKLLKKAYDNPNIMFFLIIEEVNRGNAPSIFGDIFQLLDRNKVGNSEYSITNSDISSIVYGDETKKVSIPSNMSILCTMNTSDQNVFTLDTAFQRRWRMRLIKNKFINSYGSELANSNILDTSVTWEKLLTEINKIILQKNIRMTSSEDKRLGTHFISLEDLKYVKGDERQNSRFPEKVLKYLWDDAFKFTKEDIFNLENIKSLENVIESFLNAQGDDRFKVFKENIFTTLIGK